MALSFTKSSLDMERFSTAMATVAPVAANAGVSLERTTALLGTLVSAGIDASSAGTGLRNIFLELAKSGMSFNQAMDEINNSSDKNAAALQLFGKRGAAVGSVLANSTKEVTKFEKALLSAGNVAEEMANKQLNTIAGKTKLMTSAWEGFILALEDGEGPLAAVIGGAIDLVSDLLVGLTNLLKTNRQIREEAQEAAQSITDSVANDQIDVIKILTKKGTEELKGFLKTLEETGRSVTGKASNFFETVLIHNIIRAREAGISEGEIMVKESFKLFSEFGKDAEKQLKILQGVRDKAEEGGDEFAESIFSDKEFIEFEAKVEQAVAFSQAGLDAVRSGIKDATEQDLQSIVDSTKGKLQTLAQFELDARALALNTLEGGSASGSAKRSKKELTRLQELKKELKEVEKIREKALTTPEAQRTQEFQFNTRKRDDLTKEIAQLERILALKNEAIAVRSGEIKVEDEERGPELSAENKAFENEENIAEDRRELITQQINDIQSVTEVLADEAQRRLEIQQDLLDSEAALARRRIDQLSRIAKAGQLEAGQSIAVEEKRLAELERKKLKAKQREQRIEAAVAGFKLLGDAIDKDSTRPVAETVSGILKITAALQAIPQFFDGTEDTGKGGEGVDGKGGFRAVLHPHERVVDRKNNEAMQGLSNSELAEAAKLYNTGVQSDSYKAGQMPMQLVEHAYMSNAQILKKFDKLSETMQDGNDLIANAIINKEVPYLKYDETLNAVIEGVKQGNKNTGIHIDLNY